MGTEGRLAGRLGRRGGEEWAVMHAGGGGGGADWCKALGQHTGQRETCSSTLQKKRTRRLNGAFGELPKSTKFNPDVAFRAMWKSFYSNVSVFVRYIERRGQGDARVLLRMVR